MKLSELRPCGNCNGKLTGKDGQHSTWYVLRLSLSLLHPQHARETLGLTQMFGGALPLAEVVGPSPEKAVAVMAEEKGGKWDQVFLCFDCYSSGVNLASVMEKEQARKEQKEGPKS